jgi:hypothetical protein
MDRETERALDRYRRAREALEALFGEKRVSALFLANELPHEELWGDLRALRLRVRSVEFARWMEEDLGAALEHGADPRQTLAAVLRTCGMGRVADEAEEILEQ